MQTSVHIKCVSNGQVLFWSAPLRIRGQRGEVLLFGIGAEVVVADAIPLVVEQAYEADDEEEAKSNSQARQTNYLKSTDVLL